MQNPDEAPKLPKLPFLLGDAVLLAAAVFIGLASESPLTTGPLVALVVCVALGAVLAAVPFLVDYARRQDALLTERQNSLEGLTSTTSSVAEQISIAAAGFHQVTELAQKNLKLAEHLPHKLQEKINEFNQQLNESAVAETETLQQELATLRAAEAEKLESAADKLHKLTAEFARLDATTQQSLAAAAETLAKLPTLAAQARDLLAAQVAAAVPKATQTIEDSLARSRDAALAAVDQKLAAATDEAVARTLAEIDARLAAAAGQLTARVEAAASTLAAAAAAAAAKIEAVPNAAIPAEPSLSPKADLKHTRQKPETDSAVFEKQHEPPADSTAPEPSAPEPASTPEAPPRSEAAPVVASAAEPPTDEQTTPAPNETAAVEAPTPAAATASPSPDSSASPAPVLSAVTVSEPAEIEVANAPKKRSRKSAVDDVAPLFPSLLNDAAPIGETPEMPDEFSQAAPDDAVAASARSADGLTRLIVTAYIGIGNKLYLRGEGPGLSWDKGVPLQFVSIGKWRWETADAAAPVSARLYKNDQTECSALGTLTIEPGHQAEATAKF